MSKERDEKANVRRKIMSEIGHPLHGTIAEQNFRLGWDQALKSKVLKNLIDSLTNANLEMNESGSCNLDNIFNAFIEFEKTMEK